MKLALLMSCLIAWPDLDQRARWEQWVELDLHRAVLAEADVAVIVIVQRGKRLAQLRRRGVLFTREAACPFDQNIKGKRLRRITGLRPSSSVLRTGCSSESQSGPPRAQY